MTTVSAPTNARVRLKSVALPAEHGGWGFLLEPVLLGLLVAPSAAGWWLALAGLGAFLLRQPLKTALKDRLAGRRYARTRLAEQVAAGYAVVALAAFALALATTTHSILPALLLGWAFAAVQLAYDLNKRGRDLLPEVSGAFALAALAPAIALVGGVPLVPALSLWAILAVRDVTSIVYVRARLRLERGSAVNTRPALILHLGVMIAALWLAAAGGIAWIVALVPALWLARAAYGVSRFRHPARPRTLGLQEMALGAVTVVLAAAGF